MGKNAMRYLLSSTRVVLLSLPLLLGLLLQHAVKPTSALNMVSRRRAAAQLLGSSLAVAWRPASAMMPILPDTKACYWGPNAGESCIGVYKQAVPPYTISIPEARTILAEQYAALDSIRSLVLAGQLIPAGLQVMSIVPPVTKATNSIVVLGEANALFATDFQLGQMERRLDDIVGGLGQIDVTIGQTIRGETGSFTAGQISILKDLDEVKIALDDFLAVSNSLNVTR